MCDQDGSVVTSPCFDTQGGWSGGYLLAKTDGGPGVVVGPGTDAANTFAQPFPVGSNPLYKVTAEATSADGAPTRAAVQINWSDVAGQFLGMSHASFPVGKDGGTFEMNVVAPSGSATGHLYVVPGNGATHAVRYTRMKLEQGNPVVGFLAQSVLGLPVFLVVPLIVLAVVSVARPRLIARLTRAATALFLRSLPLLSAVACVAGACFLKKEYEQHYDAQYHQGWIDTLFTWNSPSLDLGGNPMSSFGIQFPSNPWLAPDLLIGHMVPADIRIPTQIAVLALITLFCLASLARASGASRANSHVVALIAAAYCWVPAFSDNAFCLNPTLGTFWQESAVATLLAVVCFTRVGTTDGRLALWPEVGLTLTILWHLLALPYNIPFFILAAAALCVGALLSVESRRELLRKLGASAVIAAGLLAIGVKGYILNLFNYTPQIFFKTLYPSDFSAFHENTSFLVAARFPDDWRVHVFYALALLGCVVAWRTGTRFARRVVFIGLGFEISLHAASALNRAARVLPLSFTYVEQIGFPIVALLAGVGLWSGLRWIGDVLLSAFGNRGDERIVPAMTVGG